MKYILIIFYLLVSSVLSFQALADCGGCEKPAPEPNKLEESKPTTLEYKTKLNLVKADRSQHHDLDIVKKQEDFQNETRSSSQDSIKGN